MQAGSQQGYDWIILRLTATIEQAIEQADGSLTRAAEMLGMGRTTLWRKMRAHGLTSESVDQHTSSRV